MPQAVRTAENSQLATRPERADSLTRRVSRGAFYQTPTLDRLRLLSIVNLTSEFPRSEMACDT